MVMVTDSLRAGRKLSGVDSIKAPGVVNKLCPSKTNGGINRVKSEMGFRVKRQGHPGAG